MRKHFLYAKYLIRHKWFVLVASRKIGASLWLALIHDWSKLRPSEWSPYAEYFYGTKQKTEALDAIGLYGCAEMAPHGFFVVDRFNVAWNHHQKRNKHHYQYWMITMDRGDTFCLPMPRKYLLEMLADWMGAGRAIAGTWAVRDWYVKNKQNVHLADSTRGELEKMLEAL